MWSVEVHVIHEKPPTASLFEIPTLLGIDTVHTYRLLLTASVLLKCRVLKKMIQSNNMSVKEYDQLNIQAVKVFKREKDLLFLHLVEVVAVQASAGARGLENAL